MKIIFLFWNQITNFKDHIHLSLIVTKYYEDIILKIFLLS